MSSNFMDEDGPNRLLKNHVIDFNHMFCGVKSSHDLQEEGPIIILGIAVQYISIILSNPNPTKKQVGPLLQQLSRFTTESS